MSETEWLATTDARPMLSYLQGKMSDRKLRLFTVACCSLLWERLNPSLRRAVTIAESFADGLVSEAELVAANRELYSVPGNYQDSTESNWFQDASSDDVAFYFAVLTTVAHPRGLTHLADRISWERSRHLTIEQQPGLLREIFGNPFRPIALNTDQLPSEVVNHARAIYEHKAFADLPTLGDRLQLVGWLDASVLSHCRGGEPHVRGCWVLDLLLGKS